MCHDRTSLLKFKYFTVARRRNLFIVQTHSNLGEKMENLLAYIEQSRQEAERVGSSVKDFKVFDFSFIPDKPLVRPETRRIIDCLVRYQKTGIPRNLVVVGPRGCGKTLTFRYLEKALRNTIGLSFYGSNCRINASSYKVLASVLKCRPRGLSYSELCSRFEETIRAL
jgi:hypothetical protein